MTLTKEWLEQTIAELEVERDAIPGAVNEGAAMALAAMKLALASLTAEPVLYAAEETLAYAKMGEPLLKCLSQPAGDAVIPLYTATPAPLSVPECFERLLHHAYGLTMGNDWNKGTMAGHHREKMCQAVEECRAAMLQGAAGALTNEGAIPANTPCKEAPEHIWIQAAGVWPEGGEFSELTWCSDNQHEDDTLYVRADVVTGNSPAIPDGYALVPVDMAPGMMRAVQINSELGAYAAANLSGAYSLFREFWDVAVSAVPHYEVKDPAGETISEPYELNSMSQKLHYDRTFSFASAQQWVSCSERMPDAVRNIAMYGCLIGSGGKPYYGPAVDEGYLALNGKFYAYDWDQPGRIGDIHAGIEFSATHWMYWELPEAPQQEVK